MIRQGMADTMAALSALLLVSCGSVDRLAGAEVPLVSLDAADVARWTTVNDPVMGGRSTSKVAYADGGLVFSGTISLENNGGFASARSPEDPDIGRRATGATSIRLRAVGDGKTYVLRVGAAGQPWSYIQRFPTQAGVQRTYELPVGAFQPVGMRLDPAPQAPSTLDPSSISQVSVYILDEQQGPFAITITGIDAAG
ncbi:CIA30 family protein [Mycolicibacterium aromaticivorans]|nr:CIA30 family protein [Mycolicibacterium aromaticivorans]